MEPSGTIEATETEALSVERLGPYRILRQIGRGGMGTVYLAVRDDEFQQRVAIKVVNRGMDTAEVLGRFRSERQILANLDHPRVARLCDAGTTPDGRPFLVMEYVDGVPLDVFCREHSLGVEARCRLFLKVCEGVAYAHRNLVVHRDLKPGNIFVTAEGEPKLLDFGVAKLLTATDGETRTAGARRPFTPAYASPEQKEGAPAATATDVYSLGVTLRELLGGERAPDDLNKIADMATREDPARRYHSAADLARDLACYLDGRPILARPDSGWYRSRKFARRNWLALAAAALVVASLITGTAVALRETAIAKRERSRAEAETRQLDAARAAESQSRVLAESERTEADKQKDAAEKRLDDLIEMAQRALFDVHDQIASVPGGTAARQELVKTTLAYLESLEKSSAVDRRMRLALGNAYEKIAMVQGDPHGPSLRDFAGATASYHKAETILRPLVRDGQNDPDVLMRWLETESGLADVLFETDTHEKAADMLAKKVLPVAHRLALLGSRNVKTAQQEALVEQRLGLYERPLSGPQAIVHAERAVILFRDLAKRFPRDISLQISLGESLSAAATPLSSEGQLEKAGERYRESIAMREALLRTAPQTPGLKRNLMISYGNYAVMLGVPWAENLGRYAEARQYCEKAVAIAREMAKTDPEDATARFDVAMSLSRLGEVPPEPGQEAESLGHLQEAIGILEGAIRANPQSTGVRTSIALMREFAGARMEALRRQGEAGAQYRQMLIDVEPVMSKNPLTAAREVYIARDKLALLAVSQGELDDALDFAASAVDCVNTYFDGSLENQARYRADAYYNLARVYKARQETDRARAAAEKATEYWAKLTRRELLAVHKPAIEGTKVMLAELGAGPGR